MAGYVHVKAHFQRIGSGRVISSEVGFAAMDGVVTVVLEHLCQRGDLRGAFHTRFLTDTVDIPLGYIITESGCSWVVFLRNVQLVTRWRAAFIPVKD